ncbi:MAG TPA: stage III sporulation protein AB [Firmicutes bacterium]|jgi:stage III sporulation protein AB|nr:stage III sporulation protein AB [Bacillota bacterium]
MVVRLLGALLVLFATGSTGYTIARSLGERVALLAQLESLLQYLITEIDYGLTPFPQALERSGRSLGPAITGFCSRILSDLEEGKPLRLAWEQGVATLVALTPLQPQDGEPLLVLGPVLGLSDRRDQLRHLKLAWEHLHYAQREAELEAQKKQKLWRYTGLLSGLVIVLLLI